VTWSEIAINVGILLGFSSGLIFGNLEDNVAWRCMFAMGAIIPIVMIFLAECVMVESPRWLVSKGREDKAVKILQKIYGDGELYVIYICVLRGIAYMGKQHCVEANILSMSIHRLRCDSHSR
jgi:MFS family permease